MREYNGAKIYLKLHSNFWFPIFTSIFFPFSFHLSMMHWKLFRSPVKPMSATTVFQMAVIEFAPLCNHQQTCPVGISQQPNGPRCLCSALILSKAFSHKGANSRTALWNTVSTTKIKMQLQNNFDPIVCMMGSQREGRYTNFV